jgi:hypothetical protein
VVFLVVRCLVIDRKVPETDSGEIFEDFPCDKLELEMLAQHDLEV